MAKAIFFGAIGALVETSELQRKAFNEAFSRFGLDWRWSVEEYAPMLEKSGGKARIERYAAERGVSVDAEAIHAEKSKIFQGWLVDGVDARPGVVEVVRAAKASGIPLGFVTSTSKENVDAILSGVSGISEGDFEFLGHRDLVENGKPAPDIYRLALNELDVAAKDVIAIEDSSSSALSAVAAGIKTIAFPGQYHRDDEFGDAVETTEKLTLAQLGLDSQSDAA